jgi:PAS domain S-box-containing protein
MQDCIEKDVFEHFPYAHLVLRVTLESNGINESASITLAQCNPAASTLYGINPNHVAGKQLHHIFVKPIADFLEENGLRCVQQQKTLITEASQLLPITEANQSFTFNPLRDDKGRIRYLSVTALPYAADVLELQKERDHALMLMSSSFDASSLGIFVTDHQRRILRINEAFLREFNFRRRDVIGQDFSTIYVAADRRGVQKNYKSFLNGQSQTRHEWCIRNAQNQNIDVLVTMAPLHLHSDRALVVHTLVDISEHKHLEESLRMAKEHADSANRAKSAFLAGMSHELRTPLNAILGFSELMQTETFGPLGHEKYAEYMKDIHFAASHLLEIINDVLDMSKIEAGKFELLEQSIDLASLLQSVMRVMAERAEMAGVIVTTTIEEGLTTLYADKRNLRQMLFNLVSNAVKFSSFGSEVCMAAEIDPETKDIILCVKDQGPGISEKDISRMMEPFNQGQVGINDGTGTGLGLPLTRSMAELHGGTLKLDSVAGKGTTATIILPSSRNISQKR